MNTFCFHSYQPQFYDIPEIMKQMTLLQKELENTNMHNLQTFNWTYYIITKNVFEKIGTEYFENDKGLKILDKSFASYYFDALDSYVKGNSCPPAWELLFDACRTNNQYKFIYMALGVNAHVNNDLAQSLKDTANMKHKKQDFDKVNDVIWESLTEVIQALPKDDKKIEIMKKSLKKVYSEYLNLLIKNWRENAWDNYQLLMKDRTVIHELEIKAAHLAKDLLHIQNIKDLPRLLTVLY